MAEMMKVLVAEDNKELCAQAAAAAARIWI